MSALPTLAGRCNFRRGTRSATMRAAASVEGLERRWLLSTVTYDAASDFSFTNNPNGVWSYGDIPAEGAAFKQYPTVGPLGSGIDQVTAWYSTNGNTELYVGKSTNGGAVNQVTVALPAGLLDVHPGHNGEKTDVRWTAPASGTVQIGAAFTGIDTSGTTTDAHVLHNGVSLADGFINGYGDAFSPMLSTIPVAAGDTIEFTVGVGSNGTYFSDSTSLAASVTLTSTTGTGTLVPSVTLNKGPTTGVVGGAVKGTIAGKLTASVATSGKAVVGVYATTDGDPADGTLLATNTLGKVKLKAGKTTSYSIKVKSLPAGLAPGTYTLVVQATDPTGGTQTVTAGTLVVAAPVITLTSSTLGNVKAPKTLKAGISTATAVLSVANTGNVDAKGTLTVTYSIASAPSSAADVIPSQTRTLGKFRLVHGKVSKQTLSIKLPADLVAGSYYLVADVSVTDTTLGTTTVSLATASPFTVG